MTVLNSKSSIRFYAVWIVAVLATQWARVSVDPIWKSLPASLEASAAKREPSLCKLFSFGQLSAVVDWLLITALVETDVKRMPKGQHSQLFYDLDTITDLDPLFTDMYLSGANLLAVVQDDGEGALHLLRKAERFSKELLPSLPDSYRETYWSSPWQMPVLTAYVYLFELGDLRSAGASFQEAAAFLKAPPYLKKLALRFQAPGGEYEVGLRLLKFMWDSAKDDQTRKGLEKKRMDLFVSSYLQELGRELARNAKMKLPEVDPWGGRLSVSPDGQVLTTTPHDPVLGLE